MAKELKLVNLTRGRAGFQAELLQAVEDVFQTPHSLKEAHWVEWLQNQRVE